MYEWKLVRCRRWSCPDCGEGIRLPTLRQRVEEAIRDHDLSWYVTFTLPDDPGSPAHLSKKITKAFGKLSREYRKKTQQGFSYIWIKEIKKGRPHLHTFLSRSIRRKRIRVLWHDATGAEQVKFRQVNFQTLSRVVGYNTKDIIANACRYRTHCGRWYGTSRDIRINIDRPNRDNKAGWKFIRGTLDLKDMGVHHVQRDRLGVPVRFLSDLEGPAGPSSARACPAAAKTGSKGAQRPQDPAEHAAGVLRADPIVGEDAR